MVKFVYKFNSNSPYSFIQFLIANSFCLKTSLSHNHGSLPFCDFPIEEKLIDPPMFLFEKELLPTDINILHMPVGSADFFRTAFAEGVRWIFGGTDPEGMIVDVRTPKAEFAARVCTTGGYIQRVANSSCRVHPCCKFYHWSANIYDHPFRIDATKYPMNLFGEGCAKEVGRFYRHMEDVCVAWLQLLLKEIRWWIYQVLLNRKIGKNGKLPWLWESEVFEQKEFAMKNWIKEQGELAIQFRDKFHHLLN